MEYIKVIDLGHVIEVYEMERIPVNPHEFEKKIVTELAILP